MALLGAVHDNHFEPTGVHGGEQPKEVLLLWLSVVGGAPGIWHVKPELGDIFHLLPHVGDAELRPLGHLIMLT